MVCLERISVIAFRRERDCGKFIHRRVGASVAYLEGGTSHPLKMA
jgi:hypothetical protein